MSDNIIFANNASALLAATITVSDTTIQLASGFGANFPSPTGAQYFYLTLEDSSGNIEIVKITGRTGDNLTMDSVADRAQDGTTAQAFTLTITRCELRLGKAVMEEFLQKNGGTMAGDVDMNGNGVVDAVLSGPLTQILAGEIVNVPLRGLTATSTNQVAVPTDGTSRATVGGAEILAAGDDIVAQLDTAGVIILDSATTGVRIPAGAYLRVEGTTSAEYLQITHDDTDVNIAGGNVTEINLPIILNMTADLKLNENDLLGALVSDYAVKSQAVNTSASTAINYTLGSYCVVTHDANVTSLSVSNLPASGVAFLRLKMIKTAGGETCDFSSLGTTVLAPNGVAPTMSAGAGDIDVVDIWTEDGGTTWFVNGISDWTAL